MRVVADDVCHDIPLISERPFSSTSLEGLSSSQAQECPLQLLYQAASSHKLFTRVINHVKAMRSSGGTPLHSTQEALHHRVQSWDCFDISDRIESGSGLFENLRPVPLTFQSRMQVQCLLHEACHEMHAVAVAVIIFTLLYASAYYPFLQRPVPHCPHTPVASGYMPPCKKLPP